MKKTFTFLLFVTFCNGSYAQWSPSLKLNSTKSFAGISAPSNKIIWTISNDFIIHKTSDGGSNWNRIRPQGLGQDIRVLQLYAINTATCLLSVNTSYTGVGPGIIYRTSDGGDNWKQVFTHRGNCEIKIGMFDECFGLMSCSFDSFDGSVKSGQKLYYTINGGNSWNLNTINPSSDFRINDLVINGIQVGMVDYNYFYYSATAGLTWTKQKLPLYDSYYHQLQFEDNSYGLINAGALINLFVKRPGRKAWKNVGDPTGISGALTGMVLDGSECWFGMALDTKKNYYSSDSARTFTPFIADSSKGFIMMTKVRKGRTILGVTPFFGSGSTLWINKRSTKGLSVNQVNTAAKPNIHFLQSEARTQLVNINNASLKQNIPNPFNHSTTINYTLPEKYSSAIIIITDKSGKLLKEVNISGNKGSLSVNASTFSSGIYQYSLLIDGKLIESKQMMVVK